MTFVPLEKYNFNLARKTVFFFVEKGKGVKTLCEFVLFLIPHNS
jgi:hypothetical protein